MTFFIQQGKLVHHAVSILTGRIIAIFIHAVPYIYIYIASSMTLLFLKRSCIIAVHNPGNANAKKQISLSSMITSNFDTDKDY